MWIALFSLLLFSSLFSCSQVDESSLTREDWDEVFYCLTDAEYLDGSARESPSSLTSSSVENDPFASNDSWNTGEIGSLSSKRSKKRRKTMNDFIIDKLLDKYREAVREELATKIVWRRISVSGWPEELTTFDVRSLTQPQRLILANNIDKVRFEIAPENSNLKPTKGNVAINKTFYQMLLEALKDVPNFLIYLPNLQKYALNWKFIHENVPGLFLKTHDYRVWSDRDRALIKELVLDKFVKGAMKDQEEAETKKRKLNQAEEDEFLDSLLRELQY